MNKDINLSKTFKILTLLLSFLLALHSILLIPIYYGLLPFTILAIPMFPMFFITLYIFIFEAFDLKSLFHKRYNEKNTTQNNTSED